MLCGWKNSSITPDLLGSSKLSLDSINSHYCGCCGPNPSLQTEWQVGVFLVLEQHSGSSHSDAISSLSL